MNSVENHQKQAGWFILAQDGTRFDVFHEPDDMTDGVHSWRVKTSPDGSSLFYLLKRRFASRAEATSWSIAAALAAHHGIQDDGPVFIHM